MHWAGKKSLQKGSEEMVSAHGRQPGLSVLPARHPDRNTSEMGKDEDGAKARFTPQGESGSSFPSDLHACKISKTLSSLFSI